jgi:hypothetical protein
MLVLTLDPFEKDQKPSPNGCVGSGSAHFSSENFSGRILTTRNGFIDVLVHSCHLALNYEKCPKSPSHRTAPPLEHNADLAHYFLQESNQCSIRDDG